ncbi:MAG: hypothetical protein ACYC5N_02150 [Endomicrobiales bacterium]
MFELNLVRDKICLLESRKKLLYYFRLFYFVCIVLFLVFLCRFIFVSFSILAHKKSVAEMQDNIDRDKKKYQIDKLEKDWLKYYGDARLIAKTLETRTDWAGRLHELSVLVPPGVCVSQVSAGKGETGKISLKVAVVPTEKQGFEIINEFISILEANKFAVAKGVKLESQEKAKLNNGREVEIFKLSVNLPNK